MFGSEMVEVAIGMVFSYLLLSLVCSAISELIERNLKNRAADLEQGLRELLNDPDGSSLVKEVYDHGMISGLFKGEYDPSKGKSNLPSYIPSRSFALAIMGIVLPDSSGSASVDAFRQAIMRIENPPVKKALLAMLGAAQGDLNKFRDNIENWFNSTMDRVSGWYKRRSQLIVFALGFAIAVALNVNSVTIANDLWLHKAQRDALVSAARGYSQKYQQTASDANGNTGRVDSSGERSRRELDPGLQASIDNLERFGLPIGWNVSYGHGVRWWSIFLLVSLLGWFITACAISLGAPFWFDLLNKFMTVRSTIKPYEKSPEERSKN
jgi:hypothetical protein